MFGRIKHLKCRIKSLEEALEQAQRQQGILERGLRAEVKLKEESQETLKDAESRIKSLEKQIQGLTDDNTALANTANARLSALIGLKRYLDTLFEQEQKGKGPQDRPPGLTPPVKGKPYATPPGENNPSTGR
jgi:chromosome segregation ATPase